MLFKIQKRHLLLKEIVTISKRFVYYTQKSNDVGFLSDIF